MRMGDMGPPKRYAIWEWPSAERPRERLLADGARRLTTAELLGIILVTGARGRSAIELARDLLRDFGGLAGLESTEPRLLQAAAGLGPAKLAQIKAALELGRRLLDTPALQKLFLGGVLLRGHDGYLVAKRGAEIPRLAGNFR